MWTCYLLCPKPELYFSARKAQGIFKLTPFHAYSDLSDSLNSVNFFSI